MTSSELIETFGRENDDFIFRDEMIQINSALVLFSVTPECKLDYHKNDSKNCVSLRDRMS